MCVYHETVCLFVCVNDFVTEVCVNLTGLYGKDVGMSGCDKGESRRDTGRCLCV